MGRHKRFYDAMIGAAAFLVAGCGQPGGQANADDTPAAAENSAAPISLSAFEDAENWSVYAPSELTLGNKNLHDLHIRFWGTLMGPDGPINRSVDMDVRDTFAASREADWIQWTISNLEAGPPGYPNLDLLVIDRETGELRYRMFPSAPTIERGGPYSFIEVSDDMVRELGVGADGKTYPEEHALDGALVFDFGALGFVLPFIELEPGVPLEEVDEGVGFKLRNYNYSTVGTVSVRVGRRTEVRAASGEIIQSREVDVLLPGNTQLITYYISSAPPFFLGWDYKSVASGDSLFKMDYIGFIDVSGE